MSISDHPGIERIHPDDLCPECDGDGWLSNAKSKNGRGHPCMVCNGTGDTRYKGQPNGIALPVRYGDPIKNKKNVDRHKEAVLRAKIARNAPPTTGKSRNMKSMRRPRKVVNFTVIETIGIQIINPKKKKFKEFKVKDKK